KQKLEEQQVAEELKRNLQIVLDNEDDVDNQMLNLEIVPDDEDDVFVNVTPLSFKPPTIVDYKIYKDEKKENFQIIRENVNNQMYLAFSTMLKNFDIEDLEVLWKIDARRKLMLLRINLQVLVIVTAIEVVITENSIRHDLKLNDAESTSCLPNAVIFEELARMSRWRFLCGNGMRFPWILLLVGLLLRKDMMRFRKSLDCMALRLLLCPTEIREARSRQKSYADKHRRDLEFQVGDRVYLKVSPFRGVKRFGIKGKLSPRFIGPFEILERIVEVSYRLALPSQLSHVHDVAAAMIQAIEKMLKMRRIMRSLEKFVGGRLDEIFSHNNDCIAREQGGEVRRGEQVINKGVAKEMVEVITTTKIIVDDVSTVGGELNAANEEPVSAAPTNITTTQPSEATKTTVDITTDPKAKGIVFHDMEESTTRTFSSKIDLEFYWSSWWNTQGNVNQGTKGGRYKAHIRTSIKQDFSVTVVEKKVPVITLESGLASLPPNA
nr:putative reverse transcriptase domain-containing protein [Tanacetum cinerariifolium]